MHKAMGAQEHHPQKSGNCDCAVTGTCVYVVQVTRCLPMRVTLRDADAGTRQVLWHRTFEHSITVENRWRC